MRMVYGIGFTRLTGSFWWCNPQPRNSQGHTAIAKLTNTTLMSGRVYDRYIMIYHDIPSRGYKQANILWMVAKSCSSW